MPWMKLEVEEAIKSGVIRNVEDIKLDNESRKAFKEGVLLDSSLNYAANQTHDDPRYLVTKTIERDKFSNYIFPPLKRSFRGFVRITALVLLAVKKFGMVTARSLRNVPISDGSTIESLIDPPAQFSQDLLY